MRRRVIPDAHRKRRRSATTRRIHRRPVLPRPHLIARPCYEKHRGAGDRREAHRHPPIVIRLLENQPSARFRQQCRRHRPRDPLDRLIVLELGFGLRPRGDLRRLLRELQNLMTSLEQGLKLRELTLPKLLGRCFDPLAQRIDCPPDLLLGADDDVGQLFDREPLITRKHPEGPVLVEPLLFEGGIHFRRGGAKLLHRAVANLPRLAHGSQSSMP
ncbi:protein of unknown function (plasmid) [Methylocella tundrae]|uniref:Uncharacterized protein n=1 Tax=Methylocella tundrae TaxID=227605 RepID=A0A4U8Z7M2_METTU|nr:protein of unknown function [Methylocella tundrae]